jgi:multicomponent K+:H+ antiporter subunit D
MGDWIIAPVLLPALLAPAIVLMGRDALRTQRLAGLAGTVALFLIGAALLQAAAGGAPELYKLGNWPAPFGIVLVLDRLSAMMVMLTATLGLVVLVYAVATGWDARGKHFHALYQFQLMGVCGAFLTGDLFNLFVFFEVLLIASYGLMLHGGGQARVRAGVQYVVVNLAGSTLFLFAVGAIYAATGTLNMADIAVRAGQVSADDAGLLKAGGLLLLLVFGVKAAMAPVQFWLPATYANAPFPVAALFAIMTKVGAYSIIRVYTLIFGEDGGVAAMLAADWLIPLALVTLVVGVLGMLGARTLTALACHAVVASMGTLLAAVGAFSPAATAAALYYLLHSTFAGAALFLLAEQIVARRAGGSERLVSGAPVAQGDLMAGLFFAAAIGVAGMPPLSGFLGKLMVLDGVRETGLVWWVWGVVLGTSLLMVVAFARAGSAVFWKTGDDAAPAAPTDRAPLAATAVLLAAMVALTVWAGPVTAYLEATAADLHAPAAYIEGVLGVRTAAR